MFASSLFKSPKYLLAPLALALVGFASKATPTVQAADPAGVKNVLLVHGAWADGSSWNKVIANLHADGYNVTAVCYRSLLWPMTWRSSSVPWHAKTARPCWCEKDDPSLIDTISLRAVPPLRQDATTGATTLAAASPR